MEAQHDATTTEEHTVTVQNQRLNSLAKLIWSVFMRRPPNAAPSHAGPMALGEHGRALPSLAGATG